MSFQTQWKRKLLEINTSNTQMGMARDCTPLACVHIEREHRKRTTKLLVDTFLSAFLLEWTFEMCEETLFSTSMAQTHTHEVSRHADYILVVEFVNCIFLLDCHVRVFRMSNNTHWHRIKRLEPLLSNVPAGKCRKHESSFQSYLSRIRLLFRLLLLK